MIVGIDDISIFKIFFDVIMEECETVELVSNSMGMKVSLLDKGHTCFYEVFYENTFFDLFDVEGTEIMSLFIDDLYKILKTAGKNDYLTLSSDDTRVIAKFENGSNTRVFELTQSVDFTDSPTPPSLNNNCEVTLSIDDLSQSLKDLDIFKAGTIHFVCKDGNFTMATDTNADMKYNHVIEMETDGEGDSYYTSDYLKKLTKFKSIDKNVILQFGDTMPLSWSIKNDDVTVSGLIAPRIQED